MKPGLHAEAITAKVFNIKRWYQSAPPPAFFDGYRCDRLPANLLQAMRDYFGAHTYQRIDAPLDRVFHTNWTGRGGNVSSGTYSV